MEMGGVSKCLLEKGVKQNGGGLSTNGGLPYYIEVFLKIAHDAGWKKS